jgi:hypothetical protein
MRSPVEPATVSGHFWKEEFACRRGARAAIYELAYVFNSYFRYAWSQPPEVVDNELFSSDAINNFFHARQLTDATYRDGGSANNDTLYSLTWAYVKEEP